MPLLFSERALRELKKLKPEDRARVLGTLEFLTDSFEEGIIPFRNLDLRKLRGKFEGFWRLRVGSFRVILALDPDSGAVKVYRISKREKAYR